jgi:uncharacterized LabA/DUF88 family protein
MTRYEQEGVAGLHTKPGRVRKAILNADTDLEPIKAAVRGNRQRLRVAKADWEEALSSGQKLQRQSDSFSDKAIASATKR